MAGTAGFEPTHDWIKTSCLTAWPRPNKNLSSISIRHFRGVAARFMIDSKISKFELKSKNSFKNGGELFNKDFSKSSALSRALLRAFGANCF